MTEQHGSGCVWSGWALFRSKDVRLKKQMWLEIRNNDHSVCWYHGRAHTFPVMYWPLAQMIKIQAVEDKKRKEDVYIEVLCTFGVQEFQLDSQPEHNLCLAALTAFLHNYRRSGNTHRDEQVAPLPPNADHRETHTRVLLESTHGSSFKKQASLVSSFFHWHYRHSWILKPKGCRKFIQLFSDQEKILTALYELVMGEAPDPRIYSHSSHPFISNILPEFSCPTAQWEPFLFQRKKRSALDLKWNESCSFTSTPTRPGRKPLSGEGKGTHRRSGRQRVLLGKAGSGIPGITKQGSLWSSAKAAELNDQIWNAARPTRQPSSRPSQY